MAAASCTRRPADGLGPDLRAYRRRQDRWLLRPDNGVVRRADAPAKLVRALPAYPVGMVLVARLAVHRDEHSKSMGALLLAEALRKGVGAGEAAAARLVVVDAINEAAVRFYERHGFVPAPEHPFRLYRRMKDIRLSLDRG